MAQNAQDHSVTDRDGTRRSSAIVTRANAFIDHDHSTPDGKPK